MVARPLSWLRQLALGALLAAPLACLHVGAAVETSRAELAVAALALQCPVGSAGCPCTAGGGCDPGLICVSGICSYGDDGEEEILYEYEADLASPPPVIDPAPSRGRKRLERRGRANRRVVNDSMGPAAAAEAIDTPIAQPVEAVGGDGQAAQGGPTVAIGAAEQRQVIYTATLQVAVYDRDATMAMVEALPERYGGWIESRYDYRITLRIPAEHLFAIIGLLADEGQVLAKTLRADDVTAEYIDLEARIRVLEEIVAQLELLLKQATSVEQALEIRVELDRVRIELEAARAQMRLLAEQIDFSTLTLDLIARGPIDAIPSSNDPFPWVDGLGVEATAYR